ncbi:hypothetical protein [Derxia gummosa]|uniref:PEP-CTERM protein-sorting domain-containing protein n=1 Tax=Derxia gummosa DSM 723 TaxID=1121388 RepID=A0A8B6XCA4_9BURK|nr:hypothetical protein [Derxia gummosa]
MRMPMKKGAAALLLALAGAGAQAATTPLSLDYTVTELTPGSYSYTFNLVLTNASGSWASGQQWDWITFGEYNAASSPTGFGSNWTWTGTPAGTTTYTSVGGHAGPALTIGVSGALPGWAPTAVGDSLTWSGTSSVLLTQGNLHWSTVVIGSGATAANFATATQVAAVPEPTSAAFIAVGLLGLGLRSKLRRGRAATITA